MKAPNDPTKIRINFNISELRKKDEQLYQDVIRALGGERLVGQVSLPQARWLSLPNDVRDRVMDYLYTVNPDPNAHLSEEPPQPQQKPWSEHDLKYCACQYCSQERARQQRVEQQRLAEAQKPGMDRLKEYFDGKVPGFTRLLNNDFNGEIFGRYINDPQFDQYLILTPEHMDEFVRSRKSELMWTLSSGEEQLPLDAMQTGAYLGATKAQLQDLSRRLKEGQSWFDRKGRVAGNIDVGKQWQVV